jgi:pyruvate dehydrogenase E2 component (dihydrolipoamide acetyltransferase)
MASELGLDLRSIPGSGPEGRVVKRDVEQALAGSPRRAGAPAPRAGTVEAPGAGDSEAYEDVPLSSMRRIIADRLVVSTTTAPHYFVTIEVDMAAAVRAREELNQVDGVAITLNDLVVKAVATALVRHPGLNASWRGDSIRRFKSVDIGVAVALEDGLITPVIRACHLKSLGRISAETRDLVARAREKKLRPEEFKGGTFTVSNLGMLGVKHFTAIINPPEACILAVGAVEEVPVVRDGTVVPGRRMSMTLSSDHRVVDGAEAAKFVREVKALLERPVSLAL